MTSKKNSGRNTIGSSKLITKGRNAINTFNMEDQAKYGGEDLQPTGLPFGEALDALKQGKRVQRKGWNGKGLFVFRQVPAEIGIEIIPKMQSLPQSVKDEFIKRGRSIFYDNQLALVDQKNNISGWSPSTSDALAEDWVILD